jgi:hypothetical protein
LKKKKILKEIKELLILKVYLIISDIEKIVPDNKSENI